MQLATEPGSAAGTTTDQGGGQAPPANVPGTVPDWRSSLPEHYEVKDDKTGAVTAKIPLRGDPTLGRYKTGEEAARALIEQHKALSGGVLKVPDATAKPEERRAFFDKI